ncbi:hypothetical protein GLOIN_2v1866783 [Rhizophagus irregularis DAOM 181602=DAOM 197198]|uniref:Uncharacterized protein n=1 Tax=Rhizophagus irregularis (strain DAOM 181602 / DAOM 197198 / MUCL 43194) TaxID=747089 RepID=A0A2P4QZY5_RHIID|nr:hypothetical protein GLOIN_2v1866783 [Rhizophagus irregularis DAOM 181602=DAOM 197198]POG83172.1 hypothetical protein GLOIN_2v1866783 [Rhizophagus irregularis DAOM 181602=DAOM 197198]|eukprot:XP_025190038.1 hypothetical protein GLOIN_2v1866783 [Rhizophagus irregularis DAOM 181602=DAOM 197198]
MNYNSSQNNFNVYLQRKQTNQDRPRQHLCQKRYLASYEHNNIHKPIALYTLTPYELKRV